MSQSSEADLILGLVHLNSRVQRRLGGALSVHGIGLSEYLVLRQLESAPDRTMRRVDLAERVGLSPSGVTRLLNPMEKIGLVRKGDSPRDARVSLVSLSTAGKRTLEETAAAVDDAARALLGPLDREQQRDLRALLQALAWSSAAG